MPQSWKLFYREGQNWLPVNNPSEFGVKPDSYNRVTFRPIKTAALRIEVQLQPEFSGGILEWKVAD